MAKNISSIDVSEEIYDWAGEAIDLTPDGGGIIAIDNGQFGFLRLNNIQNILGNDLGSTPPSFSKLYDNYPNPFNPITFFNYDLSKDGFVNITIYDMLGNVVDNLVNTYQYAGYKSINWDATNHKGYRVSAGIYLYSIEAGDFIKTKKMILIK